MFELVDSPLVLPRYMQVFMEKLGHPLQLGHSQSILLERARLGRCLCVSNMTAGISYMATLARGNKRELKQNWDELSEMHTCIAPT